MPGLVKRCRKIWGSLGTVLGTVGSSAKATSLRYKIVLSRSKPARTMYEVLGLGAVWSPLANRTIIDLAGTPESGSKRRDRKSTRLNSSHGYISYAVFCLKKKKKE